MSENKQEIVFGVEPTPNPDEVVGHKREVINATQGIGMKQLLDVIRDHVPSIHGGNTKKEIIHTARTEAPGAKIAIDALVVVSCTGVKTEQLENVAGLYSVKIYPLRNSYWANVQKLYGGKVFCGSCEAPEQLEHHEAGD